jgi:hypothetical protein
MRLSQPRRRHAALVPLAVAATALSVLHAGPALANAGDGTGTMTVAPATVTAGTAGNQLTFTFSTDNGNGDLTAAGSLVTLTVPAGWTAPTTGNTADPGYTTAVNTSCTSVGAAAVTGSGPWTIQVPIACPKNGARFTIRYGFGTGATHVTATTLGQATFTTQSRAGSTGTLRNLAGSPAVTVNAATPAALAFTTQPAAGTTAGLVLPTFRVSIQDAGGTTVIVGPGSTDAVSLTIASGPAGGTITAGGTTATAAAGVATFTGIVLTIAGTYTLRAGDGALTPAVSGAVTVGAGPASQLSFGQGPSGAAAGSAMAPAVTVRAQDQYGNGVGGVSVTLTASAVAIDSGGTATTAATGFATFGAVTIGTAQAGLTLTATAAGTAGTGPSAPFDVTVHVSNGAALTDTADDGTGSGVGSVAYYYCAGYTGTCTTANGTLIGAAASGTAPVQWTGQPANGAYRLVAVGTDRVGNTATATAAIPVTVANP